MNIKERVLLYLHMFKSRWSKNFAVVGARLKYGYERGSMTGTEAVAMAASQVIRAASGRFITLDGSGYGLIIQGVTTTTIFGFIMAPATTCSATKGTDSFYCISNKDAIFRVPCLGTYSATSHLGKRIAIGSSVADGIQYALLGTTTPSLLRVVGGSTAGTWVDVQMHGGATNIDLVVI